jgi:hypothetical protein
MGLIIECDSINWQQIRKRLLENGYDSTYGCFEIYPRYDKSELEKLIETLNKIGVEKVKGQINYIVVDESKLYKGE